VLANQDVDVAGHDGARVAGVNNALNHRCKRLGDTAPLWGIKLEQRVLEQGFRTLVEVLDVL
jgi:hypothetical protein